MNKIEILSVFILYGYGFLIIYSLGSIFLSIKRMKTGKSKKIALEGEQDYLKSLGTLNIIYMSSPFIGLIGTLSAILEIFKDKAFFSAINKEVMADLISKLGTSLDYTLLGIIIAIPALVIYLKYKNKFNLMKNYE